MPAANQLEHAASSYLRSARHQPVRWMSWGEAAFARARSEDKPVLLDIGAVWCHWCHVMDRESYEDPQLAAIINEHFVPIKVDRDERPDIDVRYQAAVSAISGQGGWPLTVFLTSDGRPYFGGTYFPPDERYGRPGFARVLLTMATVWREQREEALESAASVMAAIEHNENFSGGGGSLTLALTEKIADSILRQFDPTQGGFGSQPKFPHPGALDLLMQVAGRKSREEVPEEQARAAFMFSAVALTLKKMAQGGINDQIAGGFHRYSVDDHWGVPHFEKMLYDNTELLRNYVHGQSLGEEFSAIAREIVDWLDITMTDRDHGGFYASQDADIHLDDDGDSFTWTVAEVAAVLDPVEFEFASRYWNLREVGDMHHNPAKNVLHRRKSLEEFASECGRSSADVLGERDQVRAKMLKARNERPCPFIDRTLYTGWNAMAITAYFEAARGLGLEDARVFAAQTLDRLLGEAWDGAARLNHVIAYPDEAVAEAAERMAGTLDDYAFTIHACVDGWQATGRMQYYDAAEVLTAAMIAQFYDPVAAAFYDVAMAQPGEEKLGVLGARRKPLQDSPTPAGNPTAASALLRLYAMNGRAECRAMAEDTLASFSGIVEHFGLYAGSYGLAVERLLLEPLQVLILDSEQAGNSSTEIGEATRMETVAAKVFAVNRSVIHLYTGSELPSAFAETVGQMNAGAGPQAFVCRGTNCLAPVTSAEALERLLAMRS